MEIHDIVTEDGYILEVHRIPYGVNPASRTNRTKRPVFLQHGLFDSDADWIINPSDKALGSFKIHVKSSQL